MITTIQLNDDVKMALSKMKISNKETYEDVIVRMIKQIDESKNDKIDILKKGYEEMSQTSSSINDEWSSADKQWD
ncbi:MAG: hypothetical protein KJ583_02780 [Nanoarchaeota archaeon]|nr:hypothetical protein [Nanoarchaeota archaeon]MBU1269432.1 hypothetical protein [Nanoarchaeota archaeon]MBU1604219.1 hypothetical protein [Nanoarchaeota archaeon]MBU2443856.1 hypothetical protein [Nanoarchaeota archaeon]